MDQGVRVAAAVSVLLGGVFVAMLFRHEPPPEGPPGAAADDRLVLGKHVESPCGRQTTSSPCEEQVPAARAASQQAATVRRGPTVLKPADRTQPPPELPRNYPGDTTPVAGQFAASSDFKPPDADAAQQRVRTHKVVDGDTLRWLAERYLGSADQAMIIYEANRSVLSRPELLPIGVELTIPPRPSAPPSPSYMPKRPLVPVNGEAHAKQPKPRRKA